MHYDIPPEIAARIDGFVGAGYASPEAVLHEALAALERRDADLAAIRAGIEDEAAGRMSLAREAVAVLQEKHQLALPKPSFSGRFP